MLHEAINIQGLDVPCIVTRVAIVGSGAAALNAAICLRRFGVDDLLIVTEALGAGTSANAGSDKQTYYRLNPGAPLGDNASGMARDLYAGGCMHGDIALIEASLSLACFHHLVHLGVPFPHNRYGDYPGFQTDHDPYTRGTSAGPRTSIMMYEHLLEEVAELGIPILDRMEVIRLLTQSYEQERKIVGLLAIDQYGKSRDSFGLTIIKAVHVVYGTGGPGALYADSVYPHSQTGSLGIALKAGAVAHNLTESQFGIASLNPRWNLSGSYQQVLPRYVSTDLDGSDKREFLNAFFPSAETLLTAQFLKGYQWPFDVRKIDDYGSSSIDLLVTYETKMKHRRVYLDFKQNPSYPGYHFDPENLPILIREYFERSHALAESPVARLRRMNYPAYELFHKYGIDLNKECLEISVCNQHLNGGLQGSLWWESNLRNFFPVGECNGTHGIYRPGGCALNSSQVGSFRAAECIAWRCKNEQPHAFPAFASSVHTEIEDMLNTLRSVLQSAHCIDPEEERRRIQERMSKTMGIVRNLEANQNAINENEAMQKEHAGAGINHSGELSVFLKNEDLLITERALLESARILLSRFKTPPDHPITPCPPADQVGYTQGRGSFIIGDLADIVQETGSSVCIARCWPDTSLNHVILEVWYNDLGKIHTKWVDVRPLPTTEDWFETVWSDFQKGTYFHEGERE